MTEGGRLFFALYPDVADRCRLHAFARSLGPGRPTPIDNVHLTLFFLGHCDREAEQLAEACAGALTAGPVRIRTGRLEHWPGARAVVVLVDDDDGGLASLHQALSRKLVDAGFPGDPRPWRPHLTLLRNVTTAGLPSAPGSMLLSFERLFLFRSEPPGRGSVYRPLRDWPLHEAADD